VAALIIGDDANRMVCKPTLKNPLLCRIPACHVGCFVGKAGDFVLFALVLSKDLPCKQKRDILVLHFKVCTFNS
jgi:hypothetical protein